MIEDLQKRQSRTQQDLEADEADFSDESANEDEGDAPRNPFLYLSRIGQWKFR